MDQADTDLPYVPFGDHSERAAQDPAGSPDRATEVSAASPRANPGAWGGDGGWRQGQGSESVSGPRLLAAATALALGQLRSGRFDALLDPELVRVLEARGVAPNGKVDWEIAATILHSPEAQDLLGQLARRQARRG